MAKYPYYIPSAGVYKPWIKASLGYRKTHKLIPVSIVALVDSGADVCFCREDIGIWLGIQFKRKDAATFTAANRSTFKAIKENITLYIAGRNYECPFYFTSDLPHETPIILGQLGFFDHFKVTFDLRNKEIEIL